MALLRPRNQINQQIKEEPKDSYKGVTTRKRAALRTVEENLINREAKIKIRSVIKNVDKENNMSEFEIIVEDKNTLQLLSSDPIVWPTSDQMSNKSTLRNLYQNLFNRKEAIRKYYVNLIDSERPIWFQDNFSDEFMHSEYLPSILDNLIEKEEFYEPLGVDFIKETQNPEGFRSRHRYILVDWMVQIHQQLSFSNETLYLSVAMFDRFVKFTKDTIMPNDMYIFCALCLYIAAKIEEVYCPSLPEYLEEVLHPYDVDKCRILEEKILSTLDFKLSIPLPLAFIRHYNIIYKGDATSHMYSRYFAELSMHDYVASGHCSNLVGASCVFLAQVICQRKQDSFEEVWSPALQCASGLLYCDFERLVENLCAIVGKQMKSSKYRAIALKYSEDRMRQVAKTVMQTVGFKSIVHHMQQRLNNR